jgi:radical SAM superfamily enzyme YgiQ (UPF0313 family)
MNVVLIQPPIHDFYITWQRVLPLGLAYLAASLQAAGHRVEIIAALACRTQRTIKIPTSLRYLDAYYLQDDAGPVALFRNYSAFGLSFDEIVKQVRQQAPNLIGVSVLAYGYADVPLALAGRLKQEFPDTPLVLGGPGVSAAPGYFLQHPEVDFVIAGEGEYPLTELANQLSSPPRFQPESIAGLGFKTAGKIHLPMPAPEVESLDALPFPARRLLPLEQFTIGRERVTPLITSRGCQMRCKFCSIHLSMGQTHRLRSIDNILAEMAECVQRDAIGAFNFEDDNFAYDPDRTEHLLDAIIERFGEKRLKLFAMNGISSRELSDRLLEKLARAGFQQLNLTVGSASLATRRAWNRPAAPVFANYLERIRRADLTAVAYIFFGVPGQSLTEMLESIIALMNLPTLIGASVFYPVPGTPIYQELADTYRLDQIPPENTRASAIALENAEFSRADIISLLKLVRLINFLKDCLDQLPPQSASLSFDQLKQNITTNLAGGLTSEIRDDGNIRIQSATLPNKRHLDLDVAQHCLAMKQFFRLRRIRVKTPTPGYHYEIVPYPLPSKLLATFSLLAADRDISGIHSKNRLKLGPNTLITPKT